MRMEQEKVFNVICKVRDDRAVGGVRYETVTVFDVVMNKNGYPHFLIYQDKQWKYVSAKHCQPIGEEYKAISHYEILNKIRI